MMNFLLDIIYPQHVCCLCREPGKYGTNRPWCDTCQQKILDMQNQLPICDKCGKYLQKGGPLCADCQNNPPPFDIARAVGPYEDPYRIAIKVFKFLGRKQLGVIIGHMMAEAIKNEPRFQPLDIIIPVPISKGNMKQRGFNQTEVLGCQISKDIKLKMNAQVLQRIKETPSQRELSREDREKNLLFAFAIKDIDKIYRKHILLVDDVYTTGSTSRECARVLLEAGAERVCVITWATGKGF